MLQLIAKLCQRQKYQWLTKTERTDLSTNAVGHGNKCKHCGMSSAEMSQRTIWIANYGLCSSNSRVRPIRLRWREILSASSTRALRPGGRHAADVSACSKISTREEWRFCGSHKAKRTYAELRKSVNVLRFIRNAPRHKCPHFAKRSVVIESRLPAYLAS